MAKEAAWCAWWPHFSLPRILEFIRSSGFWGVGVSIGLMVIHSFIPFPAELVAFANGMIYGPFLGTAITWIGAMLGASLAFGLARKLGRPFATKVLNENQIHAVDQWVARHGTGTLFISRFIPVISFNLINYAAGLAKFSWWTFGWTTGLGILPMTILMVVLGDRIVDLPLWAWLLLLGLGVLMWLAIRRFRTRTPARLKK